MVRFSIFGIPVEIQPFFWVVAAVFGGALGANSPETLFAVSLFVLAAFVSVLIHELGHALTGRHLGGGQASILLTPFGGLALNHGGHFDHRARFWMIAAGPGAGFGLFILVLGALSLPFNDADVLSLASSILFGTGSDFRTAALPLYTRENPFAFLFIRHLLWINFWWGIINLLPVLPLDGGQIADLFIRPKRRMFLVGAIAAAAMVVLGFLWFGSLYMVALFGFLSWKNYQNMRELSWQ